MVHNRAKKKGWHHTLAPFFIPHEFVFEHGVSKNYMINHHFINRIAKFLNLDKPPNHIVCCIISYTIILFPLLSSYIALYPSRWSASYSIFASLNPPQSPDITLGSTGSQTNMSQPESNLGTPHPPITPRAPWWSPSHAGRCQRPQCPSLAAPGRRPSSCRCRWRWSRSSAEKRQKTAKLLAYHFNTCCNISSTIWPMILCIRLDIYQQLFKFQGRKWGLTMIHQHLLKSYPETWAKVIEPHVLNGISEAGVHVLGFHLQLQDAAIHLASHGMQISLKSLVQDLQKRTLNPSHPQPQPHPQPHPILQFVREKSPSPSPSPHPHLIPPFLLKSH